MLFIIYEKIRVKKPWKKDILSEKSKAMIQPKYHCIVPGSGLQNYHCKHDCQRPVTDRAPKKEECTIVSNKNIMHSVPFGLQGNPSAGALSGYPSSKVQSTAGNGKVMFKSDRSRLK